MPILQGRLAFRFDGPASIAVNRTEEALGVRLKPDRQLGENLEFFVGRSEDAEFYLEYRSGPGEKAYVLSYWIEGGYRDLPADTEALNAHFQEALRRAGIEAHVQ
jgi:hypothetical protein